MHFQGPNPRVLLAGVLLFGAALPARAAAQQSPHDAGFRLRGGVIVLDLDTEVKVDGRTLNGSRVNLEDDLDFPTTPALPYGEIMLGYSYRLYLTFLASTREGDETVTKAIRFNDHIIATAGDQVHARSELLNTTLMLGTRLYGTTGLRIDVLVGAMYVHIENRFVNEDRPLPPGVTTHSSSDTVDTAGLFAGLDGHIVISPRLTLFGRILVTSYTANLFDVERFSYLDTSLGVTYAVFDSFSINLDWRTYRLELAHNNSGSRSVYEIHGTGFGISGMIAF